MFFFRIGALFSFFSIIWLKIFSVPLTCFFSFMYSYYSHFDLFLVFSYVPRYSRYFCASIFHITFLWWSYPSFYHVFNTWHSFFFFLSLVFLWSNILECYCYFNFYQTLTAHIDFSYWVQLFLYIFNLLQHLQASYLNSYQAACPCLHVSTLHASWWF